MAKLYFRYAVMNAGKSTQLLQIAYDYEKNNDRKILCIKPYTDTKASDYIISRLDNGAIKRKIDFLIKHDKDWLFSEIDRYQKTAGEGKPISIVLIDEAQFLSKDNVWDLVRVVSYLKIPVICFALKVDAFGEPFEGSSHLFALAQDIEEVTTRAMCRFSTYPKKATLHLRIVDGISVFEGEQISIEDDREIKYIPICLDEYIRRYDDYQKDKNMDIDER